MFITEVSPGDDLVSLWQNGAALRLLPGEHPVAQPLTGDPAYIDSIGAVIVPLLPMPRVVLLENPTGVFRGDLCVDAQCKADDGIVVHGMKDQKICLHAIRAQRDAIRIESSAGRGVYYNHGNLRGELSGRYGVREVNVDQVANDAARFNRNAANQWCVKTNWNRGDGYRISHSQNSFFLTSERNQGYGLRADWIFRGATWLGGYIENNRRFEYVDTCGTKTVAQDNGPAQARSYYLGPRAFRFLKVGGGTIEPYDTGLINSTLPFGFAELLP